MRPTKPSQERALQSASLDASVTRIDEEDRDIEPLPATRMTLVTAADPRHMYGCRSSWRSGLGVGGGGGGLPRMLRGLN
jgi:hypothetical protein